MAMALSRAVLVYLALILSLFLVASMAETRKLGIFEPWPPAIECDKPYGVQVGDTCFGIQKAKKLSGDSFSSLNPNLNCSSIFVGQWLCISGDVN